MRCDSLLRLLALGLLRASQVHPQQGRPCLVCEPPVRVEGRQLEVERSRVREVPIQDAVGLTLEELVAGKPVPRRVTCGRYRP